MKYRVVTARLAGFSAGDVVTGDELAAAGVHVDRHLLKMNLAVVYDEPSKPKGGRKDASDTDKD
jgi:hypothetical protein